MYANELMQEIVRRLPVHSEAERDELVAAVDEAFPPAETDTDDDGQDDGPKTPKGQ